MSAAISIDAFLAGEGFTTPWARHQARAILEQAGVTRPGKTGIAPEKLGRARDALAAGAMRVCGDGACEQLARPQLAGRLLVVGEQASCDVCGGSNNRRAATMAVMACMGAGISRLLVVGGTRALHAELEALIRGSSLELRCIDGQEQTPGKKEARSDLAWAQLLVVWASTPLPHKVSECYTDERPLSLPMITVARRGIVALCDEIARFARRRA